MKTLQDAQTEAKLALGFKFEVPADLDPADREKLYDKEADLVLAQRSDFLPNVVTWAEKRRNGSFYNVPYEEFGITDAAKTFAGEVGNQIVSLNDNLNPFSEKNRKWVLTVVVVGALIYFVGPPLVRAFLESKTKPSPAP